MKITREEIIQKIIDERVKQLNSPNSATDYDKTKNDWVAIIGYYLFETSSRPDKHVSFEEFRESLIKAAAVILSALENSHEHDMKVSELFDKLKKDNSHE